MTVELTVKDGTAVRFKAEWVDPLNDDAPTDPESVAFVFSADAEGGGPQTTYVYLINSQLVRDSVGNFHVDVDTTGMAPAGDKAVLTGEFFGNANDEGTVQINDDVKVLVLANSVTNPFPADESGEIIDGGDADGSGSEDIDGGGA